MDHGLWTSLRRADRSPRLLGGAAENVAADAVDAEEDVVRVAQALRPVVAPLLAFQRRRRIPTLEL
jgi:hypothetical protein